MAILGGGHQVEVLGGMRELMRQATIQRSSAGHGEAGVK
jgi:hypothetical protein